MMRRYHLIAAMMIAVCAATAGAQTVTLGPKDISIFKGLTGPKDKTVVPAKVDTPWSSYKGGSASRMAILLTDRDSNWLGLVHGFKSAGIPFTLTDDYREAVTHKVVLVYPIISGVTLKPEALRALAQVPAQGGTLIGSNVLGGGMKEVFGFEDAAPSRSHTTLTFTHPEKDADPVEKQIPISDRKGGETAMGTYAYTSPRFEPLATYEDGSAAITYRAEGKGSAIALGIDLGTFFLKGFNNRQENISRSYDNGYEPAIDVLLRFISGLYQRGDNEAVTLSPVPEGKDLAVMLTHDIDYTRSLKNAVEYARYEHDNHIRTTHFIQTKYIKDYNDDIILVEDSPSSLKQIQALGMELASHTVSHSRVFKNFPLGDGMESYPDYHPFVQDKTLTYGGSILGELRVSRFLLEQLVPGLSVESFRPGHLSNPYALPQALLATHYKYSSSVTANDSLTHLPFQLDYGRETTSELPVFEFPVTIEDEQTPLMTRVPQSIELARKIGRHGGICVVLIHPDVIGDKLEFEKEFIAGVKDFSWFGAMQDYGGWWVARNAVQIDAAWKDKKLTVHVSAPLAIDGLTLNTPAGLHALPGQNSVKSSGEQFTVLAPLKGETDIVFGK